MLGGGPLAGGVLIALLLGAVAVAIWPRRRLASVRFGACGSASSTDLANEVAAALDSLAMCLRAGLTPAASVKIAASRLPSESLVAAAFREVGRAVARGEPTRAVWARHTGGVAPLQLVAGAWELTERSGSALEPAMSWAAAHVRERRAAVERLDAATAGARASIGLLLFLPLSGPLFGLMMGLSPREMYGSIGAGIACLIGLGCAATGRIVSRRILARALVPQGLPADPPHAASTVDDVAEATLMLGLVLTSGTAVVESLESVAAVSRGRVAADLARVAAAYRWGLPHTDVWRYAADAWEPVAAALELALDHGAAPAAGVRAAGERLATSERSRLESAAGRAGTMLVLPLGLLFLPAFTFTTVLPIAVALAPRGLG